MTDPDPSDDRVSLSTVVAAAANLSVTKTLVAPVAPIAGDTLVYVVVTANAGPSSVTDATLVDSLPATATFVDATNGGAESGGVVTWPAFSLSSSGSRTDTIRVVAPANGTYVNVARVSSSAADPDATDDRASTATGVPIKATVFRIQDATMKPAAILPMVVACEFLVTSGVSGAEFGMFFPHF